jgi:poly(hydroxyalkanoate) granule-associated protein
MVKKVQKTTPAKKAVRAARPATVKAKAQNLLSSGADVIAKAQAEGTKMIEALKKEGMSLQRKTQALAEEKISEATSRVAAVATGVGSKANGQWDKLEGIFEERVARALNKLGVPSAKDIDMLITRIDTLNKNVAKLAAAQGASAANGATKPAVRRSAARKASAAA